MPRNTNAYRWICVLAAVSAAHLQAATPAPDSPGQQPDPAAVAPAVPAPAAPAPTDAAPRSSTVIEGRLQPEVPDLTAVPAAVEVIHYPIEPPLGFTGPTSVPPTEEQGDSEWVPMPDRWRSPFPCWDRYDKGHPPVWDYPYEIGDIWNPFKQNVLKGDYPIIGQHTFLELTVTDVFLVNPVQTPTSGRSFESTSRPNEDDFFGSPNQLGTQNFVVLSADLNHGDAAFKPTDWRIHLTGVFNVNTLNVDELAVVNPDVQRATQRDMTKFSLQEYFVEAKLADLSPYYDFVSARVGSQFFNNDFRGFLFTDTNRAIRIFGTEFANRDQFNLAYFRQDEKDTDSGLNTWNDRRQDIFIANYYHQDFIFPGYTIQGSIVYNHDPASVKYDNNGFLVRPDPVGAFQPHEVDVVYFGLASEGHIDRYNVSTQVYYAAGHDTLNPLANQPQEIGAWFAAAELSYDRDWARFRTSFLYSEGDRNVNNAHATGFDSILDNPDFAGGQFNYWGHEQIKLFGVNLLNAGSLIPDLRSSRIQGQANFVNPGVLLFNLGADFDLTPKLKWINNVDFLWFDSTQSLQVFTFDGHMNSFIGTSFGTGLEYRPLLSNNIILTGGFLALNPGSGFKALYDPLNGSVNVQLAGFMQLTLTY